MKLSHPPGRALRGRIVMNVSVMPRGTIGAQALEGKVAIVTGSTSGIGLGIARGLAASGASLVLNGFGDMAAIESTLDDIETASGVRTMFSGADMADPDSIAKMVEATLRRWGRVDILVNNAGVQHVAPI